jgi:Phosphotransferase enzyme family
VGDPPLCNPRHAWLPAVLPAAARSFRAADAELAAALAFAGGCAVRAEPDLELGSLGELVGDARCGIAVIDYGRPGRRGDMSSASRAAVRLGASCLLRLTASSAHGAMRALGYSKCTTLLWEIGGLLRPRLSLLGGAGAAYLRRFPLGAVVVGRRGEGEATIVETARRAAASTGVDCAGPLGLRESGVVMVGGAGVLRVSVGPARRHLDYQQQALETLRATTSEAFVLERVPAILAAGDAGVGRWTLEARLRGYVHRAPVAGALLGDCIDFLAALFWTATEAYGAGVAEDAERVARVLPADAGRVLVQYGEDAARALEGLTLGFGHGDFHADNLLTSRGRLVGVFDWEQAGPHLPLTDLFHLLAVDRARRSGRGLGETLEGFLLPLLSSGGDSRIRVLARATGVEPRPALLERLAIAGWLRRCAYQLAMYSDRVQRAAWMREHVEPVMRASAARRGTLRAGTLSHGVSRGHAPASGLHPGSG